MFKLIFLTVFTVIFLGCSNSSSSDSSERNAYLSPPNFSIGNDLVPITQSISLEFSVVMDPSSFSDETLNIKDSDGTLIQSTYKQDGDYIVVLAPDVYFQKSTTYTVTVGTGIKDSEGRTLSSPYSFSFTTENIGDDLPPVVEMVKPYEATKYFDDLSTALAVDVSTKIAIQFNKNLDPAQNPKLIVEDIDSGTVLSGTTQLKGSVLIFTPDGSLVASDPESTMIYEITIEDISLVKDLYGNVYSGHNEWFFKVKENSTDGETLDSSVNLQDDLGHAELLSPSSTTGTPLKMVVLFDEESSKLFLAVASSSGLEMYDIDPNTKGLTLREIISFTSEIRTLATDSSILAVGTVKDGVYFYAYSSETSTFSGLPYSDNGNMGPIYGIAAKEIAGTPYVAVVSPTTGLYIFNMSSLLDFEINHVTMDNFSPIDVKFVDDKLEIANFEYGVNIVGLDGTPESSIPLSGSTRHVALPGEDSFYANTLGIAYSTIDAKYRGTAGFARDFFGYEEILNESVTNNMLYSLDEDRGIESINISTLERSRVTLGAEKVMSAIVIKDPILEYSIMLVLGSSNSIHTFNAIPDITAPLGSSLLDGRIDQGSTTDVIITFNEILDLTALDASDFSYTDDLHADVPFAFSVLLSGSSTIVTLTLTGGNQGCGNEVGCSVTIKDTVKDLVGNTGNEKIIFFEDQS